MKTLKSLIVTLLILISFTGYSQITEIGLASFYADKFDGRVTASGEIFDQKKMTAAHRTLPFGTKVKVTNLINRKTVEVVINDRGPFVDDRVIDLSKEAAQKLDFIKAGVAKVKIEVISLKQNTSRPVKTKIKQVKQASTNNIPHSNNNIIANSGIEYYKIESDFITPTGFGIQIASYQEAANLMKRCDELKKQINKDIVIQVGDSNGSKVYRVILGTFPTRESALEYNKNLKGKFNGSFVVEF